MNAPLNPFDLLDDNSPEPAAADAGTGPGIYYDLSNEAYHRGPGISKSGLDYVAENPSLLPWSRQAPVDTEKLQALDMGTALHCLLLEPDEFKNRFIVAPPFNRRTNVGKADEAAFLAECADSGKTVMDAEDGRKLKIMRDSALAHPTARLLFEEEGTNEASIYWNDEETGELCRCRPDRIVRPRALGRPVVLDVKKVDGIDRFPRHVEEFRYHVQAAMYSLGFYAHFGEWPLFMFLVCDCTVGAGRYAVDVFDLPQHWFDIGAELYRRDLNTYHSCRVADDWLHVNTLERPRWARPITETPRYE